MTMEFLPLTTVAYTGGGSARRRHLSVGTGSGMAAGSGFGGARRSLVSFGLLEGGGDIEAPPIPAIGIAQRFRQTAGTMTSHDFGTGTAVRTPRSRGQQGSVGEARRVRISAGYGPLDLTAYGFFVKRPPLMSALGDQWFQVLNEAIALSGRPTRMPTAVLREVVALQSVRSARFEGTKRAQDIAMFGERAAWVVRLLAQEGIALGGTASADFLQVARVVARLLASGTARNVAEAFSQVVDGIVLLGMQEAMGKADITDTVAIGEIMDSLYTAVARAVSRVLLQGTPSTEYHIVAVVRDAVALGANLSSTVDLVMLLQEAVGFAATLSIDSGEYVAWVLNAESKGLSRYTNYPFNSMAKIGRKYIGAASDGLHLLDGEDDNGEDINAFIRAGIFDVGTRLKKRMPEAFIAYTSDGTLVLRVIIVDEDGNKSSCHYRLPMRGAGNKQANRFKIGRGLESIDWAFELHNVEGADFDLSGLEFRPLFLSRRTRG